MSGLSTTSAAEPSGDRIIHIPYHLRQKVLAEALKRPPELRDDFNRRTERWVYCRKCGRVHIVLKDSTRTNVLDSCYLCRRDAPVPVLLIAGQAFSLQDRDMVSVIHDEYKQTFEAGD